MADWDWVEVIGPTVETAVQAAVEDLGLDSADAAEIEVMQEPKGGFLGIGGQDAIVRVRPKPKESGGRRRRRGGRGRGSKDQGDSKGGDRSKKPAQQQRSGSDRNKDGSGNSGKGGRSKPDAASPKNDQRRERTPRSDRPKNTRQSKPKPKEDAVEVEVDRAEQAEMVKDFLSGLLDAFGLEGVVETTLEDETIIANVTGEQTEALVGTKGAILQSIHELCRTIVQRKSQAGARLRLDIAGYQERRREALRIYTGRLVEKVMAEGGEIMLEPMNPAERKVVHDAAAEIGGVRTFSEGEEPHRSVVIAKNEE